MYKVFIDNVPIYFQKAATSSSNISSEYYPNLQPANFQKFKAYCKNQDHSLLINSPEPLETISIYFSKFKWIEAAGGIVSNIQRNDTLFIFRNGRWDLPKGKIEENESPETAAVREIKEECGLKNLIMKRPLLFTFHVYFAYEDFWIKKTHWFHLASNDTQTTPQIEEDITQAKWFSPSNYSTILSNTYENIKDILVFFNKLNIL